MNEKVNVFDYSKEIIDALAKGVLITTKADDRVNSMVVSWGAIGIEWGKPIFTIYIRESRFTKELLDKNGEFTVNIPTGTFDKKKIMNICGSQSGHDIDKIKEANLTLVESEKISVPGIKELPLTLECKVIYKQKQDKKAIGKEQTDKYYPYAIPATFHGSNRDYHTAYYGEIVNASIIK